MTATNLSVRAWHRTITAKFALLGMAGMSFLVRLPEVKLQLGVSTSELGILLFAGAVGSIFSLLIAARMIARFGTKPQMLGGFYLIGLGLIGQAVSAAFAEPLWFGLFIFVSGFGYGITDVPVNVDGAEIEKRLGRSILPRLHAAFSVGALSGAAIGTLFISWSINIVTQILILTATQFLIPIFGKKFVPSHTAQDEHHQNTEVAKPEPYAFWRDTRILLLGLGILCITLAEGAANDWLALSIVEDYEESATNAGIAFAVFNLAMTVTRFFGGSFADRFGRKHTVQVLALTGTVGILLVTFGGNIFIAWIGSALWGVGAALGFPLFVSEAGEGENSARKVTVVTTFGYLAFLVGPPSLGLFAEHLGLLTMLSIVAAALALATVFAQTMSNRKNV